MAKCKKCNGIGRVENCRYWNAKAKYNTDWYLQFEPYINCRECKGTGYVLSDVKDAIDYLKVFKNNPNPLSTKDFKISIEILEKLFND